MYAYVNHFAFERSKVENLESFKNALMNLAFVLKELADVNFDLIFDSNFSHIEVTKNQIKIKNVLFQILNEPAKKLLIRKLDKGLPFTSDSLSDYIDVGCDIVNCCLSECNEIDAFGTFLACSVFNSEPVITVSEVCSDSFFLKDGIELNCTKNVCTVPNFILSSDYIEIVEALRKEIIERCTNWQEYFEMLSTNSYIRLTSDIIKTIVKLVSFKSSNGNSLRKIFEEFIHFQEMKNNNEIKLYDYSIFSREISDESKSVKTNPKLKQQRKVINSEGLTDYAFWHVKLQQGARLYFIQYENYVCLCQYTNHLNTKMF